MTTLDQAFQLVPLAALFSSPFNPRTHFDTAKLDDLARSIRSVGIIEPLVVRPDQDVYEIVAGERRFRAAKLAELGQIPVLVRNLTDAQVLEIQVVENNQRDDVNPIEEAEGYARLLDTGYALDHLAERIGRSTKYVYDRLKLRDLIPPAKKLVVAETISAGHAILLARLKPADQKRAIDRETGWLFAYEAVLWNPDGTDDREDSRKPRSVRELQASIDEHVRFEPDAPTTPMLFPETHEVLSAASANDPEAGAPALPVIHITHDHYVQPDAKAGKAERIYGPRSWKRADGSRKDAKACAASVLGVVVVGPDRGQAFRVCAEKTCQTHWPEDRKIAAVRQRGAAAAADKRQAARNRKDELTRARLDAARAQWKRVAPAVLEECGEKLKQVGIGLLAETASRAFAAADLKAALALVGKSVV